MVLCVVQLSFGSYLVPSSNILLTEHIVCGIASADIGFSKCQPNVDTLGP
jgi:hypothetical protein